MEEEEEEAKLVILPGMIIYMIIYTKGSRMSALPTLTFAQINQNTD